MKVEMVKMAGGALAPASDIEAEKMAKFKTGLTYSVELKGSRSRNQAFHGKMFAFFNFCFEYWKSDREFLSEAKQFDHFRKELTKIAGFYEQYWDINGNLHIEAKSLEYGKMNPEEFAECYSAIVNAAMKHIFVNADYDIENKLMSFF